MFCFRTHPLVPCSNVKGVSTLKLCWDLILCVVSEFIVFFFTDVKELEEDVICNAIIMIVLTTRRTTQLNNGRFGKTN